MTRLLSGALALLLSLAACQTAPAEFRPLSTLTIRSEAEVLVAPDQATISIHLNCLNKNINKSRDCLLEKSQTISDSLSAQGIKPEDIQTTAVNQYKEYRWERNSQVFAGYNSSTQMVVNVKQLAWLEKVYPLLLSNEDVTIGELRYSHSRSDSLSQVAYRQALTKANTLADGLLPGMGKKNKQVLRIGNVPLASQTYVSGRVGQASDEMLEQAVPVASPRLTLNTGQIKITEALYVEYGVD